MLMAYRDEPDDQAGEIIETERVKCSRCGRFYLREIADAWGTPNKGTKCDPCAHPTAPERFVRGEISAIVAQIREPKTNRPAVEVPALVADLCGWMEQARQLDRVNQDWRPA